ncbi:MAG: GTP-binding protein [Lachnospiraceae bacterium]|nr:GTP-binding protein [Lachnospiraceae bacterium]
MIKLDLVTGFLGSGKTTFLKNYAAHLVGTGQRIAILENDYGAINVDMMLLKGLESEKCDLEMVVGGNDADCHRRRFKSKLIALGMLGYDRVLVEPSGIYDVDEFFDVLHEDPIDRWYEPGSVIAVVDAGMEKDLSRDSRYVLASETVDAGILVMSRTQMYGQEAVDRTLKMINDSIKEFGGKRTFSKEKNVLAMDWKTFSEDEYRRLENASCEMHDLVKILSMDDNNFTSLFYMDVEGSREEIVSQIRKLFTEERAGHVFRVKGFLKNSDGGYDELNATRERIECVPVKEGQEVLIVIGEDLQPDVIAAYFTFRHGTGRQLLDDAAMQALLQKS